MAARGVKMLLKAVKLSEAAQSLGSVGPIKAPKNARAKELGTYFPQISDKFSLTIHLHEKISHL